MTASQDCTWDYLESREYLERVRGGMPPLIVSVAITGGVHGKEASEYLPESVSEQVEQTAAAYEAGASVVHIHARKPDRPDVMSVSSEDFLEVNRLIRERCPEIIINNTAGGDLVHVEETGGRPASSWACMDANPEMVAFDCGPLAHRLTLRSRPEVGRTENLELDDAYHVTFGELERYAAIARERGIKPEFEIAHSGQFWLMDGIVERGLADPPHWVQFVLGVQNGNFPTPANLIGLVGDMPRDSLFSVIGIAQHQLPLTTLAIILGGHVRVGLEDNLYFRRREKAVSNAQLVKRVVRIANELERPVATPRETREMLGLRSQPSQY